MSSIRLPDAMPDVDKPTLLVVCDTHHCRILSVGGHQMSEEVSLRSDEVSSTDPKEGRTQSPAAFGKGGLVPGMDHLNPIEANRLKTFGIAVTKRVEQFVREQKIEAVHFSAPGKFLSVLRDHLHPSLKNVTKQTIDGSYVKEGPLDILVRFRPDLNDAVKSLREQENYSPRKLPPK